MIQWLSRILCAVTLLTLAACSSGATESASKTDEPLSSDTTVREITIKATNYKFEPAEIKVKKGEKVKINLVNEDGMHEMMIQGLRKHVKPGNPTEFVAEKTGEFAMVCSVFCGSGHGEMISKLIVEE